MLTPELLHTLQSCLPASQIYTDRTALIAYESDAGLDRGLPVAVVFPRTVDEVIRVVLWAKHYGIPLIARGAGTGLSGGAVADRGGIILEFVHFNRICSFDALGRSAVVESALINLRLDEYAKQHDMYFPPDPSSQRASTIGGNVAENSGGPHCFKYGVTTNYVTGMEVILADGRLVRLGGPALDYPEYDFIGLMTGSEGMLGLMTNVTVRLLRNPPAVQTLLAIFDTVEQAGTAVSAVIAAGLVPATMEMMDRNIVRIIEPFAHAGLPLDAGAVLIVEVDGYATSLDQQMKELSTILRDQGGYGIRIAQDADERVRIWQARKSAAGGIAREVPAYYTVDITVPRSCLAEMLLEVNQICERYELRVGYVFHAGDGNLHPLILIPDPDDLDLIRRVHQAGWEMVQSCVARGGSLTGEHGVGIEKRQYMPLMHRPSELLAMWDIKQVFDPQNILNPGKVFPLPEEGETIPYAGYAEHISPAVDADLIPSDSLWTFDTAEQLVPALVALSAAGRPALIGHAWSRYPGTIKLDVSRLNGISAYKPDDLYITVGAGTPLQDIQSFLATDNKQLALASPWPDATIGGLVSANVNAPLRLRYGALRDQVLCATVVLPDGRMIRTGRPLVKNVAGYDLTKAFIGAQGTLGVITDVSLKISTRPRVTRTLVIPVADVQQGMMWGQQLLRIALNASALILCRGYPGTFPSLTNNMFLVYTVEGMPEDVIAELAEVRASLETLGTTSMSEVEGLTGTHIWQKILQPNEEPSLCVRTGVAISELSSYVCRQVSEEEPEKWVADFGSGHWYARRKIGVVNEAQRWLKRLRAEAGHTSGYAVVMDMPGEFVGSIDRWGYKPASLDIMRRLKATWDRQQILNPGVFLFDQ